MVIFRIVLLFLYDITKELHYYIAIAKLRLETLHTYTHPNTGTVYHLYEGGVINDTFCLVCPTCKTAVSFVCSKNVSYIHLYIHTNVFILSSFPTHTHTLISVRN